MSLRNVGEDANISEMQNVTEANNDSLGVDEATYSKTERKLESMPVVESESHVEGQASQLASGLPVIQEGSSYNVS